MGGNWGTPGTRGGGEGSGWPEEFQDGRAHLVQQRRPGVALRCQPVPGLLLPRPLARSNFRLSSVRPPATANHCNSMQAG